MSFMSKKNSSNKPVFLDEDTLASILRIHVIDVKVPVGRCHQQARELLDPDKQNIKDMS